MSELSHLSLFSGIGGIDRAAEWAGFRSVGQVERDPYCRQVLQKNFQNTYIWNDIHDLTIDTFREHCGKQSPVLLSGGFPCQPFSVAGKQESTADDRYLWPEMFRVVQELRPSWVLGENVPGIIPLALDDVLSDLESVGYSCRSFILPACGVGAPHKRDRVFIVAHSDSFYDDYRRSGTGEIFRDGSTPSRVCGGKQDLSNPNKVRCNVWGSEGKRIYRGEQARHETHSGRENVSDSDNKRCEERNPSPLTGGKEFYPWVADSRGSQWAAEPGICGISNGVPSRVDRLRALGNAVVPQQVYPILQGIADIEMTSTGGM